MNALSLVRDVYRRLTGQRSLADLHGQVAAITRSQAVAEFAMDGTILTVNSRFCEIFGYTKRALAGRHHHVLVEASERASPTYRMFWEKLARGEYDAGIYRRMGADAQVRWMRASYNPILDMSGRPFKVVEYATDVTEEHLRTIDLDAQMAAIRKAQLVAEFDLEGRVLSANDNFLRVFGYRMHELLGAHHRKFVEPRERDSAAYKLFWRKLSWGEYDAGIYHRVAKDGRVIWLQASYNPIFDTEGRPFKVVKYATDITAQTLATRTLQQAVTGLSAALVATVETTSDANDIARDASQVARRGDEVIGQVVETIGEIKRGAQTVTEIVTVIDDIAFQTNLLALNASIEAAWAGEQGQGFAHVASEVRLLAARSATSAKDVRSMIGASVERAGSSDELVALAGEAMREIVDSMARVTGKMHEIKMASIEQATGLDAINEAVAALADAPEAELSSPGRNVKRITQSF